MAPIVVALQDFDAKNLALGKAYVILLNLEKHVFSLREEPFKLDGDIANVVEAHFFARKQMTNSNLQCTAILLYHYLFKDSKLAKVILVYSMKWTTLVKCRCLLKKTLQYKDMKATETSDVDYLSKLDADTMFASGEEPLVESGEVLQNCLSSKTLGSKFD